MTCDIHGNPATSRVNWEIALATGLALSVMNGRHLFCLGFHFGLFQALMPVIGLTTGVLTV
jgi:putative Mn2+ efflux pump MntP